MAIEHVSRGVTIDNLFVSVTAWRFVCDACGVREAFADSPMPEGCSEVDHARRGWQITYGPDDTEGCLCPTCAALRRAALSPEPSP